MSAAPSNLYALPVALFFLVFSFLLLVVAHIQRQKSCADLASIHSPVGPVTQRLENSTKKGGPEGTAGICYGTESVMGTWLQ